MKALEDHTAKDPTQLSFKKGDILKLISKEKEDWWMGSLGENIGHFPSNLVVEIKINLNEDGEVSIRKSSESTPQINQSSSIRVNNYFYF